MKADYKSAWTPSFHLLFRAFQIPDSPLKRYSPTSSHRQPPVPKGGQLSITAGGMTEGNGTCGLGTGREGASPKGANHTQSCPCSPPLGTIGECVSAIRRFHDLRSFHPRLFTFAPFGDGECLIDFLPQKRYIILPYLFFSFFLKENPRNFRKFQ